MTTTIVYSTVNNYESGKVRKFAVSLSYDKHDFFIVSVYEDKEGVEVVSNMEKFTMHDKKTALRKHSRLVTKYSNENI